MSSKWFLSAGLSILLLPAAASAAEGFVQLADTRLFCVVSDTGNVLSTIPEFGGREDRAVADVRADAQANLRLANRELSRLQNKLSRTVKKSKRAAIKAQIARGKFARALVKLLLDFANQCGSGALNSQAQPTPNGAIFF